jgi:peptidoglycan/LPS O-acetylase OafA/YrhL
MYFSRRSIRIKRPAIVALCAATAFLLYGVFEAVVGTETLPVDRRLVYGLLSGVLIFTLVHAEAGGQLRINNRWMSLLGDSSYSLYLIHYPLVSALCKLMIFIGLAGSPGAIVAYPVILCACILTSVGFYLLIEKPILRALSSSAATATLVHGVL